MLRGASLKSTCSRMACAARVCANKKNEKSSKLQPHIQRTRAERIRTPPVGAKAEGYRKTVSECKRERSLRLDSRETPAGLPADQCQPRADQQPGAGLRNFATATIAAGIAFFLLAGIGLGVLRLLPDSTNAGQRRGSDRGPGLAAERIIHRQWWRWSESRYAGTVVQRRLKRNRRIRNRRARRRMNRLFKLGDGRF